MYAVIFRAKLKSFDDDYAVMAARMRDLAMKEFGCIEFTVSTEKDQEIAISYWPSIEHIKAWRQNPEHQQAQKLGKSKWYASYQVQITKVLE